MIFIEGTPMLGRATYYSDIDNTFTTCEKDATGYNSMKEAKAVYDKLSDTFKRMTTGISHLNLKRK